MKEKPKYTRIDRLISTLEAGKGSISCVGQEGLLRLMQSAGFQCKKGSKGQHYVLHHKALNDLLIERGEGAFFGVSINCGHRPKKPILSPYILKAIRTLRQYKAELEELLDEQ